MPNFLKIRKLETIAIFFAFLLPSIMVSFLSVTHASSSRLIGGLTTVTVITYLVLTKTPIVALGLTLKWQSLLAILPGTLLIAIVQLLFLAVIPWFHGQFRPFYLDIDYSWYFCMTIFQEIIWRGFAFLLLDQLFPRQHHKSILISALLFSLLHIHFKSILIMVGSFLLGIYWGRNYLQYRSIFGVSLSHYFVGLVCIMLNYMGIRANWSWL